MSLMMRCGVYHILLVNAISTLWGKVTAAVVVCWVAGVWQLLWKLE